MTSPILPASELNLTDIRHGTPEWHAARSKAITGTDVPAILGNSKWKTPLDVWTRVLGLDSAERHETAFMRWGNLVESIAASEFESITGMAVTRNDRLAVHPRIPHFIGSPDGFAQDAITGESIVLEFKAPSAYTRDEWAEDKAPEFYVNQLEAYLCITGLSRGVLCALLPPMAPDDELIVTKVVTLTPSRRDEIEGAIVDWWERHIINEEQPDAVHRDEEYLRKLHPNDEPRTALLDPALASEYAKAAEAAKKADEAMRDAKARVIQQIGNAAWAATEDGGHAFSFKTSKRGTRSLRSVPQLPKAAPQPRTA